MYILHLPSWTPNENDPLNGNFIDKQIEAISLYAPSITLRLIKDKTKNHTEINKNNLQNIVITKYLKASFWDKIIGIRQLRLYLKGRKSLSAIINQHGKPAFIHLHVAYPYGVIAVGVAKSLHIPLILSEHWSAYLTHFHANKKDDFSPFQRSLIRSVFIFVVSPPFPISCSKIFKNIIPKCRELSFPTSSTPINFALFSR